LRRDGIGEFYFVGIFAAAKMTHLSRDETATKMGHPIVVAWSDVGYPANSRSPYGMTNKGTGNGKSNCNGKSNGKGNCESGFLSWRL
jgi:hypothetical protein